ncbi:hypothetical protein [Mycobacterium gastri]|nr:hypothetical protein [Mycobacterium gastri]
MPADDQTTDWNRWDSWILSGRRGHGLKDPLVSTLENLEPL